MVSSLSAIERLVEQEEEEEEGEEDVGGNDVVRVHLLGIRLHIPPQEV